MPIQTRSMTKREQIKDKLREECLRKKAEMEAVPQRKERPAIQAKYTLYSVFVPPEGVELLSPEECDKLKEGPEPPTEIGYWWIKWDTLYYIGTDGNIHEIEPFFGDDEGSARKYPEETEEIEWTVCE